MPTMVKMIAELSRAQSAWSWAPRVRKFHNQRIREILVVTWPYARPSVCTQGRSVRPGEEARRKFSSTGGKRNLGTDSHPTISERSSECWLLIGQKKCFVLLCPISEQYLLSSYSTRLDHGLSGSCTKEMHTVRKLSVPYKLSTRKLKTLIQKQAWAYR